MNAPPLVPALKDLCLKAAAAGFLLRPLFGNLSQAYIQQVTSSLSLDVPLDVAAVMIADESYWQRRAIARWKHCDPTPHGCSWKQLYMERNLQEAMEQFDAVTGDFQRLRQLMAFSSRFVQGLRLQQLPSHMDLQVLFDAMQNSPTSLALSFNPRSIGMNYDSMLHGMKLADCRLLARALIHTETLVVLDLSNNSLDDDKARMLASGLADNISVTHLNLSHNRISDRGVRALSKLLDSSSVISVLDLSGNQLQADSGRSLGRALGHSQALLSLNLRLNRLGDEGCKAVCDALSRAQPTNPAGSSSSVHQQAAAGTSAGTNHGTSSSNNASTNSSKAGCPLERLNMSSNGAGVGVVLAVCGMLRGHPQLKELDISCNSFGERMSTDLVSAAASNTGLIGLEVRGCGLGAEAEQSVEQLMLSRLAKKETGKLCC